MTPKQAANLIKEQKQTNLELRWLREMLEDRLTFLAVALGGTR